MVQEFQVLRCYSCQVFQVHQVKKSKKWSCKLCGEKQSVLKVYGKGSGADCRHHVQKLNLLQGEVAHVATDAAGDNCENAISDDDGDETKQNFVIPQETASLSRWNKYLEENGDTHEEEKGLVTADQEHYYSHQDCAPRDVRKRKHVVYHGGDFYKEDIKESASKRNKVYQRENHSESIQVSCPMTDNLGCLQWHDKPISHTLLLQTRSETFLPMNTAEGHFKESTCNTTSFLKREPKMDTNFSLPNHCKNRPDCSVTISQEVLPNDQPTATNRLFAQNVSSPSLAAAHQHLETSSSAFLQKQVIRPNLFQTDDDFDDDY
ncbi:MRN complex-interacting protein [Leptodactylus fuscus]|uniref:MRN complex-interacting protein n=1 Tax=Leptodactylus fuscus TaxID=238119 RepID=UPI003F4E6A63